MQGVRLKVVDIQFCVGGEVGIYYVGGLDVNNVISCLVSFVIFDFFFISQNDIIVGGVKYCCRNGIIFLVVVDFFKLKFVFIMQVYKIFFNVDDVFYVFFFFGFKIGNGIYICGVICFIVFSFFFDFYLDYVIIVMKIWQV